MATDYRGNIITSEQIEGLRRFEDGIGSLPLKSSANFSTVIGFEIDEEWQREHEEDAEVYWLLLPPQIYNNYFEIREGEEYNFAMQYSGDLMHGTDHVIKRFCVAKVNKEIDRDTTRFCLHITASVIPLETND